MTKTYFDYDEHDFMRGPYPLTSARIDRLSEQTFGVYVLADDGPNHRNHRLTVYIGRGYIKTRLLRHEEGVNAPRYFSFVEIDSLDPHEANEEAFRIECALFHKYGKARYLNNRIHPARPKGRTDLPLCAESGCTGEAY